MHNDGGVVFPDFRRRLPQAFALWVLLAATEAAAYDVTISSAASTGGNWSGGSPDIWTADATGSNVSAEDIQTRLALGGVVISADNSGAENGDIFVNGALSWSANSTLILYAYRNVNIGASLTATGNAAGLILAPDAGGAGGSYSLNNSASITLSGLTPSFNVVNTAYTVINAQTILDAHQLQPTAMDLSANYALGSNIDLTTLTSSSSWNSSAGFVPIGDNTNPFTGTFDGLGHTISNLVINRPTTDYVGLFGYTAPGSVIQNVGLVGGSVSGGSYVGGLVGYNYGTVINNYATGQVQGSSYVGGLAGSSVGTVINSHTAGQVQGSSNVGGLVGGGICGSLSNSYRNGSLNNCYSGTTNTAPIAGLVGAYNNIASVVFSPSLQQGWNLLGNSLDTILSVASQFGDQAVVTSVWKWDAANAKWQFYTPSMDAATLQTYANDKGYEVLSTINPGEGYWVNATTTTTLAATQTGTPFNLTAANLVTGWNLVTTGNIVTPANFNATIGITTLWSWDNAQSNWYFYAPSLGAQGGTALADYITTKSYLDFNATNKTLEPGMGFWVNKP